MVCRFVQYQQIGSSCGDQGNSGTGAFTTGKLRREFRPVFRAETVSTQQGSSRRFTDAFRKLLEDGAIRIEAVISLIEVCGLHAIRKPNIRLEQFRFVSNLECRLWISFDDSMRLWRNLTEQNSQERRFARTVWGEQRNSIPDPNPNASILENDPLAVMLGQVFGFDQHPRSRLARLERHGNLALTDRSLHHLTSSTFRPSLYRLGTPRQFVVVLAPLRHPFCRSLEPADLETTEPRLFCLDSSRLEPLRPSFRVTTLVYRQCAALEMPGFSGHRIQQRPVMRDDQQRARILPKAHLEPFTHRNVQVVRGFIQHQHIRFLAQGASEGQACAFATGQRDRLTLEKVIQGERMNRRHRSRFGAVPARPFKRLERARPFEGDSLMRKVRLEFAQLRLE